MVMKSTILAPLLAGLMLAATFALAAIGANDASEAFPEPLQSKTPLSMPPHVIVADWAAPFLP